MNSPLRVGITGQAGFIGSHLFNWLGLFSASYKLQPFEDVFFDSPETLQDWVASCDVIVHLAAMNRHAHPRVIYETNLALVKKLIQAMESAGVSPQVIFASSTQEDRDNPYGKSKREGRELLHDWSVRNGGKFCGMIIPNVFGPFGQPNYNSVIATFCHRLTHDEEPKIEVDGRLKLIYIGELVEEFRRAIDNETDDPFLSVDHSTEKKVSYILAMLSGYKRLYWEHGIIPAIADEFELRLFNTFRCFMNIREHYPVKLSLKTDDRGDFVETIKTETGGQFSFSSTKPGITRGNHFHTRKIERFIVIRGQARIQLRRIGTNEVLNFDLSGDSPSYVDMPVWYTHNITNTGTDELYTLFWVNEIYNPADPDTYFEKV